jgi:signal transduction histidine kinase
MKNDLERDILRYGLLVTVGYMAFLSVSSVLPVFIPQNAIISLTMGIVSLALLIQLPHARQIKVTAVILHLMSFSLLNYFWINYGGLSGAVPGILILYIIFIMMTTSAMLRWIMVSIMAITILIFFGAPHWVGMVHYMDPSKTNPVQLLIDYLLTGSLFMALITYARNTFTRYHLLGIRRNQQLDRSVRTLHRQNSELAQTQEKIRLINESLELVVEDRAAQIRQKNDELSEYAFINAHMLRGPLCRILGLLHLMEKEPHLYTPTAIAQARIVAAELDTRIREINKVTAY